MKVIQALSICACLLIPAITFAHVPAGDANSLAPMLQTVMPAVVNVSVVEEQMKRLNEILPVSDTRKVPVKAYAVGSGVVFNAEKGLIVTNAHVVQDQKAIVVTLKNGERFHAKLLAKDADYDIAILQIHAPHLTALPFANSDTLKVGDFVTAIGSPYGLSQTVTSGVVSALDRSHPQIEGYQSFIQTDAPINPGNSGGALVDMKGNWIGINTAMVAPSDGNIGIGFAIPSNMAQRVVEQLLKYGKVEHGVLGVIVQNITPELESALNLHTTTGAMISEIVPETPAAASQLKIKDVITRVDGHVIKSAEQLRNVLGLVHPGTSAQVTLLRDGKTETIPVTIANPKTLQQPKIPYLSGMRLQKINELEKDGTHLQGLMVTALTDASTGALAGLALGDVITAIDSKPVTTIEALQTSLAQQQKPLLLSITRGNNNFFLVLNRE
ncbi:MAG: hypothetical protein ACD_70C00132G0002 [uncultured bacterium]|nr:MAG: hypothetical protein ACD_70C00132G0002 [uncultured bacterium]OGT27166.1 MAG: endopeptidase [Gammaproteobacteria bacterium RIFCSPHIGHO2_02_FULL_42_43]OGT29561.1 MAG: endopeptidase [Gammaproteobacteria bacterium RIFCSPHIGHO2_01_FULL_42_8]OGT50782.1 MAG: endopeptidase [Gammaproteobacteria bacterium RIFCSPHIGHO2_12_FULL_41_25]OGT61766.1 MAG: endopeptidase [Gammaproteobacteria bacterium RIFCSPLOWO2_02_FULL_42_14]OGT85511.1 MAG: endopeptidase [Gammaproteobacteria bacterium RIFCSPLOWO2_12_FUL